MRVEWDLQLMKGNQIERRGPARSWGDGPCLVSRWPASCLCGAIATIFLLPSSILAQDMAPQADPRDLGIRLSTDNVTLGQGERFIVADEAGEPVVAKLHLQTGDRLAVILPSGRMIAVDKREATETDRPFEAIDPDELKSRLIEGKFKGFNVRETRHYLFIYNTSELYASTTSRILETMYPALYSYCRRKDIDVHDPETPLVVIMFRTQDEFQTYREMPSGIVAYYNSLSNYVVMYEQSNLAEVAPMLAVKQSISTVAHEGVHQILHNIGVQQRLSTWPAWISEGLPEYFAPTSIDRRIRWKGVGDVNDLRMHSLVKRMQADDGTLANGGLVEQVVKAETLDADGYAAAWALTFFLAQHRRNDFFAYLKEVSEFAPLAKDNPSNEALFAKHFGDDYADLQAEMIGVLSREPYVNPVENQPHYVAFFQIGGRRMSMVTTSPRRVTEWRDQILSGASPNERARARFVVDVYANKTLADQAAQAGIR